MRELSADTRATCEDDYPEVNRWTFDDEQEAVSYGWSLGGSTHLIPFVYASKSVNLHERAVAGWGLIREQAAVGIPIARKAFRLVTKQILISGHKPAWAKEEE